MREQTPPDVVEGNVAIGVKQVRLILVKQILDAIEPLLVPG